MAVPLVVSGYGSRLNIHPLWYYEGGRHAARRGLHHTAYVQQGPTLSHADGLAEGKIELRCDRSHYISFFTAVIGVIHIVTTYAMRAAIEGVTTYPNALS